MKNDTVKQQKNQWLSQINELLYVATEDKSFWQLKNNTVQLKSFRVLAPQDRCAFNVRNTLAIQPKPKKDRSNQFEKSYNEWQWVRDRLKNRNLNDDELREGLRQIKDKIKIFGVERENGLQPIESYTKGTARYDRKKAFEAMDFIKNHCDGNWELYFLTVTCSVKLYKSRANAWENYDKTHIKKPLENLRKHYDCEYIRVLESFASGYPHAHCVLAFPKGTYPKWETMENKEDVKDGKIYDWIKSHLGSPVFNLQIAKGDNTKFYLTKYLTKYAKGNVLDLLEKKGKFSKSERKLIQELVYVKAFRKHTLEHCKDRSKAGLQKAAEKQATLIQMQKVKDSQNKEMFAEARREKNRASRWRKLLTRLCINSPLKCDRVIRFMSAENFKKTFSFYPEANKPLTEPQENTFKARSCSGGCGGCFYSELIKFVLGDKNSLINQKPVKIGGKTKHLYFSDKYDLSKDDEFMACIAESATYYFKNTCLDFQDFIHLATGRSYLEDDSEFKALVENEKWKERVKDEELKTYQEHPHKAKLHFFADKEFDNSVERSYNEDKEVHDDNNKRFIFRQAVKRAIRQFKRTHKKT